MYLMAVYNSLINLGEAVSKQWFPPSHFDRLAIFMRGISHKGIRRRQGYGGTGQETKKRIRILKRGLLFAGDLDDNGSFSGAVEFAKINALPGSELHLSVVNKYRLAASDNRAFDVSV